MTQAAIASARGFACRVSRDGVNEGSAPQLYLVAQAGQGHRGFGTLNICQESRSKMAQAPVLSWESLQAPWSRLHIDFNRPFYGQVFFIILSAFSK